MADVNVTHDSVRTSNVTGTNVYNTAGESIGEVDDIIIGKSDGRVRYAILSFGGFLGIGEQYHPLPWAELKYNEQQKGFVINRTREQLEGAPHYGAGAEPDWGDRTYGERVYGYYGVPYI